MTRQPRLPAVPAISSRVPREIAQVLLPLKQIVEALQQGGVVTTGGQGTTAQGSVAGTGAAAASGLPSPVLAVLLDATLPPPPTGVQVHGGMAVIIIEWAQPAYRNHGYTEVWRADRDDFSGATLVGTSRSTVYTDAMGGSRVAWYWLRHVSTSTPPRNGPFNSVPGTRGETGQDASYVLDLVKGKLQDIHVAQLNAAKLVGTLQDWQIEGVSAAKIAGQLLDSQLAALNAAKLVGQLNDSQLAAINASKLVGQLQDAQLAALSVDKLLGKVQLNQLAADVEGPLGSAINTANQALTKANEAATATSVQQLQARLSSTDAVVDATQNRVATVEATMAGKAETAELLALKARVGTNEAGVSAANQARIDGDAANASRIETLAADVEINRASSGNLLQNSDWDVNTDGWWFYSDKPTTYDSNHTGRDTHPDYRPYGRHVLVVRQIENTGASGAWCCYFPAVASRSYIVSAYVSEHRAYMHYAVAWENVAGERLGVSFSPDFGVISPHAGEFNAWPRRYHKFQAPAGAVRGLLHIVKLNTIPGNADSWLFVCNPMVEETSAPQPSPYSPGSPVFNLASTVSGAITRLSQVEASNAGKASASEVANLTAQVAARKSYRLITRGNDYGGVIPTNFIGLAKGGTLLAGGARSYCVSKFHPEGSHVSTVSFDLFGTHTEAIRMVEYLNAIEVGTLVAVWTYDEPAQNHEYAGVREAMYRCGASSAVFGAQFKYRCVYVLIGKAGIGEGRGYEAYAEGVSACIDVSFDIVAGNFAGITPGPGGQASAALNRVAKVEADVAGKASASEVTELRARVGSAEAGKADKTALEAAVTRVQAVESGLAGKASAGDVSNLIARVGSVESGKAEKAVLEATVTRLGAAEASLAGKASASDVATLLARVGQTEAGIAAANQARADGDAANAQSINQVNARLAPGGDIHGSLTGKAAQTALDAAVGRIATAEATLAGKAAASSLDALSARVERRKPYRLITRGNSYDNRQPLPWQGLADEYGTLHAGAARSYVVVRFGSDGNVSQALSFDVYGAGAASANGGAAQMAAWLNALPAGTAVAVYSYDEPKGNRLSAGLPDALYRCGGSPAVFAAAGFAFRSVYLLLGRAGSGTGAGYEAYVGAVDNDPAAMLDVSFELLNGQFTAIGPSPGSQAAAALNRLAGVEAQLPGLARAQELTQLSARLDGIDVTVAGKAAQGSLDASNSRLAAVEVLAAGKAAASTVDTLQARIGNAEASVSTLQTAQAGLDGRVSSKWGVMLGATTPDGRKKLSGLQAFNDGSVSQFVITADQLLIQPSGSIINLDPNFTDASHWIVDPGPNANPEFAYVTAAAGTVASTCLYARNASGTGAADVWLRSREVFPINPEKVYRLSGRFYSDSGNGRTAYLAILLFDSLGNMLLPGWGGSWSGYPWYGAPSEGSFTEYAGNFGPGTGKSIPSNATQARVGVILNYGAGGENQRMAVQDLRLEEVIPGTLIRPGEITTAHLVAQAVTADKLAAYAVDVQHLRAGAVTADKLAVDAVTARVIKAGEIQTGHFAPQSVTADKINVSALSAITANIGLLRTAASGARMELESNQLRVYDANNVLRVRLGVW